MTGTINHETLALLTITLVPLLLVILLNNANGQSHSGIISSDTIVMEMKKAAGFGPSGNYSVTPMPKSGFNKDVQTFFPTMANLPEGLQKGIEYFFITDEFQFYFQNYCIGKYGSASFFRKAQQSKWNLSDTLQLSREPIRCGFAVYAGFTMSRDPVYVIDANGNDDFSDDALRPLVKRLYDADKILAQSVPVQMAHFQDGKIAQEKILVFTQSASMDEDKLQLSFMFPEFRFNKFTYKGASFIICMDAFQLKPTIAILPDEPRFTRVSEDKKIEINQYLQIGDMRLQFIGRSRNGDRISLLLNQSESIKTDRSDDWGNNHATNTEVASSQVGYNSPEVKGVNIISRDTLSTKDLTGKYVFLDFWSTSCGPCIAEFKYSKEAYLKFDRAHFQIIGVVDERRPGATEELLKKHEVTWPNIKTNTSGTVTAGFNVLSYPTTYLLDPSGKIIAKNLRGEELMNLLRTLIKK